MAVPWILLVPGNFYILAFSISKACRKLTVQHAVCSDNAGGVWMVFVLVISNFVVEPPKQTPDRSRVDIAALTHKILVS